MYLVHRHSTYNFRLTSIDLSMLSLATAHAISDTYHNTFESATFLRIYGEWLVPYLAGRLAVQELNDVKRIAAIFTGVTVIVATSAIFEAVSGVNWWDGLAGPPPEEHLQKTFVRWNLSRPHASTMHPMYLGQLLVLLLPWCVIFTSYAHRTSAILVGVSSVLICVTGVCFSTSRAAILGLPVGVLAFLIASRGQIQKYAICFGITAALAIFYNREELLTALHRWSGEAIYTKSKNTIISGTMTRVNLFKAYAPAIEKAGLLGFGTHATAKFPPMIPRAAHDPSLDHNTRFIDNSYLLLYLRFGLFGLLSFIAAVLASVWTLYAASSQQGALFSVDAIIVRSILSGLAAVIFGMSTVWCPPDYGFLLLWTMGIASGLHLGPLNSPSGMIKPGILALGQPTPSV
jgi:O-Antigen ligase